MPHLAAVLICCCHILINLTNNKPIYWLSIILISIQESNDSIRTSLNKWIIYYRSMLWHVSWMIAVLYAHAFYLEFSLQKLSLPVGDLGVNDYIKDCVYYPSLFPRHKYRIRVFGVNDTNIIIRSIHRQISAERLRYVVSANLNACFVLLCISYMVLDFLTQWWTKSYIFYIGQDLIIL